MQSWGMLDWKGGGVPCRAVVPMTVASMEASMIKGTYRKASRADLVLGFLDMFANFDPAQHVIASPVSSLLLCTTSACQSTALQQLLPSFSSGCS